MRMGEGGGGWDNLVEIGKGESGCVNENLYWLNKVHIEYLRK